jgi:hypothetical protein
MSLADHWNIWAHIPRDACWTINSYRNIAPVRSVQELLALSESISPELVKMCMLFVMRDGVEPMWEHTRNKRGGCFSYKIVNKVVVEVWKALMYATVGETLCTDPLIMQCVTGIAISPKKNFCIVKIWMSNCTHQNPSVFTNIPNMASHGCIFKKHEY